MSKVQPLPPPSRWDLKLISLPINISYMVYLHAHSEVLVSTHNNIYRRCYPHLEATGELPVNTQRAVSAADMHLSRHCSSLGRVSPP